MAKIKISNKTCVTEFVDSLDSIVHDVKELVRQNDGERFLREGFPAIDFHPKLIASKEEIFAAAKRTIDCFKVLEKPEILAELKNEDFALKLENKICDLVDYFEFLQDPYLTWAALHEQNGAKEFRFGDVYLSAVDTFCQWPSLMNSEEIADLMDFTKVTQAADAALRALDALFKRCELGQEEPRGFEADSSYKLDRRIDLPVSGEDVLSLFKGAYDDIEEINDKYVLREKTIVRRLWALSRYICSFVDLDCPDVAQSPRIVPYPFYDRFFAAVERLNYAIGASGARAALTVFPPDNDFRLRVVNYLKYTPSSYFAEGRLHAPYFALCVRMYAAVDTAVRSAVGEGSYVSESGIISDAREALKEMGKVLHNPDLPRDYDFEVEAEDLCGKLICGFEAIGRLIHKIGGSVVESLSPNAINQIRIAVKGPENKRENVIAFIRTIYKEREGCSSLPKTIGYVRNMTDETNPDYPKCAAVQAYIKSIAKKEKDGVDKAWKTLAQEAKPTHGKKKKSEDIGPVPILSKGSDFL